MSNIPKHLFNSPNGNIFDNVQRMNEEKSDQKRLSKTILTESTGIDTFKSRRGRKNLKRCNNIGDIGSCRNQTQASGMIGKRKDYIYNGGDSDDIVNRNTNLKDLVKSRRNANKSKRTWHSESSESNNRESDSIDASSSEVVGGLSASSILELYDSSIRSDNAKLRNVRDELKRNYTSCFLKHELVTTATLCSTRTKNLLKPCPKIFMVNNEPCYDELKFVLKNVKSLKNILISKNAHLLENRILLDVLQWIFFESKLPTFIEVKFQETINELYKIDVLRLPVKQSLITKVKYGQYSNQELDYRYFPNYLKQNREEFEVRLGFVAVPMQLLYQVLANGMDVLIRDKKGVPIYFNFIASVESIQNNVYLLNSDYNTTFKFIFEYFAILMTELIIPKDIGVSIKDEMNILRNPVTTVDSTYYMKNVEQIKAKVIFFFKIGSSRIFRKLVNSEKKMHVKYMLEESQDEHVLTRSQAHNTLFVSLHVLAIFISIICFIWYMKTWRYF